jgi:hypothetical protein
VTDAEKLAVYERVLEIVQDQLALEKYFLSEKKSNDVIQSTQVNAYSEIVKTVVEVDE